MSYELKKLLAAEKKYGKIVVGVDFDDTIFPLDDNQYNVDRCFAVRRLLTGLIAQDRAVLCLWTVAEDWSMMYKKHIITQYGLKMDYFNESPIVHGKNIRKPHFNILLDDKAGLNETIKILEEFINTK